MDTTDTGAGDAGAGDPGAGNAGARQAPPTAAGDIARPAMSGRPAWPGVIGTLVIVFSGIGILGGLFGVAGALITFFASDLFATIAMQPGAHQELDQAGSEAITSAYRLQAIIGLFASLMLLTLHTVGVVAGAKLIKRRADSIGVLRAWAFARIALFLVIGVVYAWLQLHMMDAMGALMAQDPNMPAPAGAFFGSLGVAMAFVGALWQFVWGWSLPIVVLWWLGKGESRAEIDRWRGAEAHP
ncbi:MAG: hypothetical protein AAFP26_06770 [Planctomycetota bacterium]